MTIVLPGAGHLYLGMNQKSIPYLIANVVGLFCAVTVYLFPIAFIIWVVTVLMTAPKITAETEAVNREIAARSAGGNFASGY